MLSSVTINCQVTKIVMNSGSQLSELYSVSQMAQVFENVKMVKNCNCQNGKEYQNCITTTQFVKKLSKLSIFVKNCQDSSKNSQDLSNIVKICQKLLKC